MEENSEKPGDRGAHGSANNVNSSEKWNTIPAQNARKDNLVVPKIPSPVILIYYFIESTDLDGYIYFNLDLYNNCHVHCLLTIPYAVKC